jgi:hypothetical protein
MVYVSSTMWRIKNPPSNSISCSDNTMPYACWCLWRVYYIENFKATSSFSILKLGGLREVYYEGLNRVWRALRTSMLNINWFLIFSMNLWHRRILQGTSLKKPAIQLGPPNRTTRLNNVMVTILDWILLGCFVRLLQLGWRPRMMHIPDTEGKSQELGNWK